ncbi:hypothetical protein T265_12768, partial [Opisthorchis viverrini]
MQRPLQLDIWENLEDVRFIAFCLLRLLTPQLTLAESAKDSFCDALGALRAKSSDTVVVDGGMNAQVGRLSAAETRLGGRLGLDTRRTDNGDRLLQMYANHRLSLCSTNFRNSGNRLTTWCPPTNQSRIQADHITVGYRWRGSTTAWPSFWNTRLDPENVLVCCCFLFRFSGTECVRLLADVAALTAEAERSQQRARSTGPSDAEQKRFEAELSKLEKTVKQKVDLASKKRMEAESLKAQLLDVGSARLTAVRSRLDAIEKKTKETNDQLTKLQVGVKTAARNFEKSKSKVASIEAELEAAKQKLTDVDAKLKDLEEEARTCMDEFKKIQADVNVYFSLGLCPFHISTVYAYMATLVKSVVRTFDGLVSRLIENIHW